MRADQKNRILLNKIVKLSSQLHNIEVQNARLKRALAREKAKRVRNIRI